MPSLAYINFLHIRIDVIKLIDTHALFSAGSRGRKNLGHITRSAVVMLCAAWERYNEDLLLECIDRICNHVNDINLLSKEVKKSISQKVRSDKNENRPIEMAGDGWKIIWKNYAKAETEMLNTPKRDNLDKLFEKYLGILNYSGIWKNNCSQQVNDFVKERGNIAHNGNRANYIRMNTLRAYQELIVDNVIEIDSQMATRLQAIMAMPNLPWTHDYSKEVSYYR